MRNCRLSFIYSGCLLCMTLVLLVSSGCSPTEDGAAPDAATSSAPAPKAEKTTPAPGDKKTGEKPASVSDSKSPEEPAPKKEVKPLDAKQLADLQKQLGILKYVSASINELEMEMDKVMDNLTPYTDKLKATLQQFELKIQLKYIPCFEASEARFLIKEKSPWSWSFTVQKGGKNSLEAIRVALDGKDPVIAVTKEGRVHYAETLVIPFGLLAWSAVDVNGDQVGESIVAPFLEPGRVTASVAMPSEDAPQFLNKIFDINLIAEAGHLKLLNGYQLYFEPKGKAPVAVPLFEYYQKKRAEQEKKRGAAFEKEARPSPVKNAIGNVVYMEIVDNIFRKTGITERNDSGFTFYFENSAKQRIPVYIAAPGE